jgi:hypothetical protein
MGAAVVDETSSDFLPPGAIVKNHRPWDVNPCNFISQDKKQEQQVGNFATGSIIKMTNLKGKLLSSHRRR